MHEPIVSLAMILVLGVAAQWLAWRIRVPSILLLLLAGMCVGPLWSWMPWAGDRPLLDPDSLFGDLLLPMVSLSVGLILYEGGLSLNFSQIVSVRRVLWRLVSLGALLTWVLAGLGAAWLLGLSWQLSALFGAILIVTGPTVIGPLLNHIRPTGHVGQVLRWEGIIIDPIGALLAVLVYEALLAGQFGHAAGAVISALLLTVFLSGVMGFAAAMLLAAMLKRYWIPDSLQNPVSVLLVLVVFVVSGQIQHESGLWAVTVMGITLANQKLADIHHIIEFKENLRVLLISALFITLGARISQHDLMALGWESLLYVVFLIVVVRPVSVWLSTLRSEISPQEQLFLAGVAPRGIVAAAVASVFAISLEEAGLKDAGLLVPHTFAVILGTVAFYGLAAGPIARKLGLSTPDPQGLVIVGAALWVRQVALAIDRQGFRALLIDTNYEHIRAARLAGLQAVYGSVLNDDTVSMLDLAGIGRSLAMTPNDEVNALASQRFMRIFERANVYRLASPREHRHDKGAPTELPGRLLFAEDATYALLASRLGSGWVVKVTALTEAFTYDDYHTLYGSHVLLLFLIEGDRLIILTPESEIQPRPGQSIVAIVNPETLFMLD